MKRKYISVTLLFFLMFLVTTKETQELEDSLSSVLVTKHPYSKCSEFVGKNCESCYRSGSDTICTSCFNGTPKNGSCTESVQRILIESSQPSKSNLWMILLPSFYGTFLVFQIGLIIFCLWKKRSHKRNKIEEASSGQNEDQYKNESVDEAQRYVETIQVQSLSSNSNNGSEVREAERKRNIPRRKEPNNIVIKANRNKNSLVIRQNKRYDPNDDSFSELQNVRQQRIPEKSTNQQKMIQKRNKRSNQRQVSGPTQSKRKLFQNKNIIDSNDFSLRSNHEGIKTNQISRNQDEDLIYYQQREET